MKAHRNKLDSRSRKRVYLGYKLVTKGRILFDLQSKESFVSIDVPLFEHHFPYKHPPIDFSNPSLATHVSDDTYLDDLLNYSYTSNTHPTPVTPATGITTSPPIIDHATTYVPQVPLSTRKSTRQAKPLTYLQDYHCNLMYNTILISEVTGTNSSSQYKYHLSSFL